MNTTLQRSTILLTGATGCIGGRLLAALEARGYVVRDDAAFVARPWSEDALSAATPLRWGGVLAYRVVD